MVGKGGGGDENNCSTQKDEELQFLEVSPDPKRRKLFSSTLLNPNISVNLTNNDTEAQSLAQNHSGVGSPNKHETPAGHSVRARRHRDHSSSPASSFLFLEQENRGRKW